MVIRRREHPFTEGEMQGALDRRDKAQNILECLIPFALGVVTGGFAMSKIWAIPQVMPSPLPMGSQNKKPLIHGGKGYPFDQSCHKWRCPNGRIVHILSHEARTITDKSSVTARHRWVSTIVCTACRRSVKQTNTPHPPLPTSPASSKTAWRRIMSIMPLPVMDASKPAGPGPRPSSTIARTSLTRCFRGPRGAVHGPPLTLDMSGCRDQGSGTYSVLSKFLTNCPI